MLGYLISADVVFPWVVALDVHHYQLFLIVPSENNTSGGPGPSASLEGLEVGLEHVVKQGAFPTILSTNDGCNVVLLVGVLNSLQNLTQCFFTS